MGAHQPPFTPIDSRSPGRRNGRFACPSDTANRWDYFVGEVHAQ